MGMTFTVRELAERVAGHVEGDPDRRLAGIAPAGSAGPDHLTYVVNERYARCLADNEAGAALVPQDLEVEANGTTLIRVDNPELAFSRLISLFVPGEDKRPGVHPTAVLESGVRLGSSISVGPFVTVGRDATIGDGTEIGAGTIIGTGVVIGEDCSIRAPRAAFSVELFSAIGSGSMQGSAWPWTGSGTRRGRRVRSRSRRSAVASSEAMSKSGPTARWIVVRSEIRRSVTERGSTISSTSDTTAGSERTASLSLRSASPEAASSKTECVSPVRWAWQAT